MTVKPLLPYWVLLPPAFLILCVILALLALVYRTIRVLRSIRARPLSKTAKDGGNHLLIVLGSGGHTAEMISILHTLGLDYIISRFCGPRGRRTWVVSEGDGFSADRAQDFEKEIQEYQKGQGHKGQQGEGYDIVVVPRARRVHQSLRSTPVSALWCLWSGVQVLRGRHHDQSSSGTRNKETETRYPDLILTNGPGTAVIVVLASLLLKIVGLAPLEGSCIIGKRQIEANGLMRSIYVESWARVKTLSLSGKILRFIVGRFLVQWRGMENNDLTRQESTTKHVQKDVINVDGFLKPKIEYVGTVVT